MPEPIIESLNDSIEPQSDCCPTCGESSNDTDRAMICSSSWHRADEPQCTCEYECAGRTDDTDCPEHGRNGFCNHHWRAPRGDVPTSVDVEHVCALVDDNHPEHHWCPCGAYL